VLKAEQIVELFEALNLELRKGSETAEVGIVGGAVMCLVFNTRAATRDVDAIFEPTELVRRLAAQIGEERGLPGDWLNDAAKGFIQGDFSRQDVLNLSNLRVWAPDARYMLAMKCMSARWDTSDRDDVMFLLGHLELTSPAAVYAIIEAYYPRKQIPPKTQFFIEEVLEA
jgi:hypothetical protein